jgi:hypothetical protein
MEYINFINAYLDVLYFIVFWSLFNADENVEVIIHPSRLATQQISHCHLSEGQ